MPLHPAERDWSTTLREDREAIILADQLGYYDCFVGEHLTDIYENITSSMVFLASLVSETRTVKLATGTSNLTQLHPVITASYAAMLDHMAEGRFIFGISAGALPSDSEALGMYGLDAGKVFEEAINVILEIWRRDPPYDIDLPDNRFKVSTARTAAPELGLGALRKPLQKPYPEIVGTVVAPYSKGVIAMGRRDFHPLSAHFLLSKWVATHWPNYVQGKQEVGVAPATADWRVARTIFVADDERTAVQYGRKDEDSPYRFYYRQMMMKMLKYGRAGIFKADPAQPDSDLTLDGVLEDLVICGTPETVAEEILKLREEIGDFGEIVYGGMDWVDPVLAKRSMELMATEVMPRVRRAIGEETASKGTSAAAS